MSGWIVRYTHQASTRRTNSAYSARLADGVNLNDLLDRVENWYAGHGAPAQVRVSSASVPENLDMRLGNRGYEREGMSVVEWAACRDVGAKKKQWVSGSVDISETMSDAWSRAYRCGLDSDHELEARLATIERIRQPKALARCISEGDTVAVGLGVYDTGWTGIYCMFTKPEWRGKGFAHDILSALNEWTQAQGGDYMYLHVEEDNAPARAFYEGRGFIPAYDYHYRTLSS